MHGLAEQLAAQFIRDFWSADHEITWTSTETERIRRLDARTLLVGRVDATGITPEGKPFFGEWKTMSGGRARYMDSVKAEWRFSPQALTYGVLVPETHLFTVRWAIKPLKEGGPCRTDYEWYSYTDAECEVWHGELLKIAQRIRTERAWKYPNWPLNPLNCFRYGQKYRCQFFDEGCSKLAFGGQIGQPRSPHLEVERKLQEDGLDSDVVVLDASRVEVWLECHEKYRRTYEGVGSSEEAEALTIGKDFHSLVAAHIKSLIPQEVANG